jgi:hypothetical protein
MDLAVEPDTYSPINNENGDYIDQLPPSSHFKNGLRCTCGSRKEHVFDSRQSFSSHIKTKTHQKWLADINLNRLNYFSENIKLNDTVYSQKLIIAKLQRENENLQREKLEDTQLITELKKKLELKETYTIPVDLINFD